MRVGLAARGPPAVLRYTYTVAEELHIATITVDPDRPLDGCTGQFELRARGDCRLIRHAQTPERAAGRAGVCRLHGRLSRRAAMPTATRQASRDP